MSPHQRAVACTIAAEARLSDRYTSQSNFLEPFGLSSIATEGLAGSQSSTALPNLVPSPLILKGKRHEKRAAVVLPNCGCRFRPLLS